MAKKKHRKPRIEKKIHNFCIYDKEGKEPDYKEYKLLAKFLSDRAKIASKKRSGLCSRHQRKISIAIKRARHLGLLPYSPTL